jgi:hypothetical protein
VTYLPAESSLAADQRVETLATILRQHWLAHSDEPSLRTALMHTSVSDMVIVRHNAQHCRPARFVWDYPFSLADIHKQIMELQGPPDLFIWRQ